MKNFQSTHEYNTLEQVEQTLATKISEGKDINDIVSEYRQKQDAKGRTLAHIAAEKGHVAVLGVLLNSGVALDTQDNDGNTPLHAAIAKGNIRCIKVLLDSSKSGLYFKNKSEMTPLDLAKENGLEDVVIRMVAVRKTVNHTLSGKAQLEYKDMFDRLNNFITTTNSSTFVTAYHVNAHQTQEGESIEKEEKSIVQLQIDLSGKIQEQILKKRGGGLSEEHKKELERFVAKTLLPEYFDRIGYSALPTKDSKAIQKMAENTAQYVVDNELWKSSKKERAVENVKGVWNAMKGVFQPQKVQDFKTIHSPNGPTQMKTITISVISEDFIGKSLPVIFGGLERRALLSYPDTKLRAARAIAGKFLNNVGTGYVASPNQKTKELDKIQKGTVSSNPDYGNAFDPLGAAFARYLIPKDLLALTQVSEKINTAFTKALEEERENSQNHQIGGKG